MSKVLVMPGVVIGRAYKTPVSPDPTASAADLAAAPVTDVLLTVAPGADSIKTGEIRFHVPELGADEFLRDTPVDIIIAHQGHMTDTAQALQDMEKEVAEAQQARDEQNADNNSLAQELVTAQDNATSLQNQLTHMTERAEAAEASVAAKDEQIAALQKQITDFQTEPAVPIMPTEPEGNATVVDDKVPEPKVVVPEIPQVPVTTPATPESGS